MSLTFSEKKKEELRDSAEKGIINLITELKKPIIFNDRDSIKLKVLGKSAAIDAIYQLSTEGDISVNKINDVIQTLELVFDDLLNVVEMTGGKNLKDASESIIEAVKLQNSISEKIDAIQDNESVKRKMIEQYGESSIITEYYNEIIL